jgi:hypothetical protein
MHYISDYFGRREMKMNKQTIQFDYYYGNESEQFSFYRIPKALISNEYFRPMSLDAKMLYGLMLDRMSLSVKNGWADDENRIFIYFTIIDAQENMNCKSEKAVKLFGELERFGLIERIRQGQGRPAKIYIKNFVSGSDTARCRDAQKRRGQDFGKSKVKTSEKQKSRHPKTEIQDFGKTECNNTDRNYTERIQSIHQPETATASMDRIEGCRQQIHRQIEYGALCQQYGADRVYPLAELILETVCSEKKTFRINSENVPAGIVKERFSGLSQFHIEYVIGCLRDNTTKIKNIKQYLLTALFNAPLTMGPFYCSAVNHDLHRDNM